MLLARGGAIGPRQPGVVESGGSAAALENTEEDMAPIPPAKDEDVGPPKNKSDFLSILGKPTKSLRGIPALVKRSVGAASKQWYEKYEKVKASLTLTKEQHVEARRAPRGRSGWSLLNIGQTTETDRARLMAHGVIQQAQAEAMGFPNIPEEQRNSILRMAMSNPELNFSTTPCWEWRLRRCACRVV